MASDHVAPEDVDPTSPQDEKRVEQRADSFDGTDPVDGDLVDFAEDDSENPLNWSPWKKWSIILTVSSMNLISIFATTTIIPAAPQVLQTFHTNSSLYRTLLVTIWDLGEGIGPFFIAPLSEKYGRMPVFHVGNVLAIACSVACALSVNISMLVAFRFLTGIVLTALTLTPSIAGDLFAEEKRGAAMTIAMGCQLVGEFSAPLSGSFVAQALGWRWTLWLNTIAIGAVSLIGFILVRETYAVTILERKTARLRKETGNGNLRSKHQAHVDAATVIGSMTRPVQIMFMSPIVAFISFYMALAYALVVIVFTTLTEVMEGAYGFNHGTVGLTFLGLAIGTLLAMLLYGLTSDPYIKHKKAKKQGAYKPEYRLSHLVLGGVVLPFGFLLYGWTLAYRVQYVVPLIGTCGIGFCMTMTILPTENYLVDVYPIHGASAVAAGVILRALAGALFPLLGPSLYHNLGYGWGNSVLALIAAVFVPFLFLVVLYGERIRGRENLTAVPPD